MKIVAVICNIVLFGLSWVVFVTGLPSTKPIYVVFTLWIMLNMVFNVVVISFFSENAVMKVIGIVCNIVFLGFVCYAIVDQHPFPAKASFYPFVGLMLLTPFLSLVAFLRA